MKRGDFLVIAVIIAFSLASLALLAIRPEGRYAVISENDSVIYQGSIHDNATIRTEHNTVEISDGHVRIIEADCPDKLCIQAGEATSSHPVICLPNRLVVRIQAEEEEIDAVSY